jgi:NAD(P)-dependent dehydrogenase (short-subunit alcohol dehydrogenase family)
MAQVLISGANRGLGLEFTKQFLQRGDRVVATCRHPARATELTRLAVQFPGRLHVLPLDVAQVRSMAELAREVELLDLQIDLLINNAGVLPSGERFGGLEAANMAQCFAINVQGPVLLTQALASRLRDGSKIVALASRLGSIAETARFGTPSYSISKAALNMAMRQIGFALAERQIGVICLSPGWVRTSMGGANADLEPEQSVANMLAVIDAFQFDATDIAPFISNDGQRVPW